MPSEVPGASQLGSLDNQGYAGPCCTEREHQFALPEHDLATTEPVRMRRTTP